MKVAIFDSHGFERLAFERMNEKTHHKLHFLEPRLTAHTAVMAQGHDAVCAFVNDRLDSGTLKIIAENGVKLIALRSAGFNHVDLPAAAALNLKVVRVPAYSPHAVAEHAACLILALNRKIHRAYARVREHNFSLEGLVGFDLHGKTVGVIGTGKIGKVFCRIMTGFGCRVLAYDLHPDSELVRSGLAEYVKLDMLYQESDIVSLHVPLTSQTRHMIDHQALEKMKAGIMLINTGRGGLIDSQALIGSLKSGHLGSAGLDVYEEEEKVFFQDLSNEVLQDDCLARLLTFPNVIITSHQAFLTREALENIAETTLLNMSAFEQGKALVNEVCAQVHVRKK